MLKELKEEVLRANLQLRDKNLVIYTWGNVSGIDRDKGLVVIKPSGVPYEDLDANMMVVVDLDGNKVEGELKPSSDTPTHLELYREFKEIGGIVHTHSRWATVWAQAQIGIPCLGTTHADHFYGEIPCTRLLTPEEIKNDYELNTGKVIVERFKDLSCLDVPGVLVASHAPFTWGRDPMDAVYNSVVLEEIAMMAFATRQLNSSVTQVQQELLNKHFKRKHGPNATYGQ